MKAKKSSINRRLLNKMTEIAPQMEEKPKPMLRVTGKEARAMHGMKPGSKVKMMVHGRLMNVGLEEYGPEKGEHTASVEVHKMRMHGKGDAGEKETKGEDKAEGGMEE